MRATRSARHAVCASAALLAACGGGGFVEVLGSDIGNIGSGLSAASASTAVANAAFIAPDSTGGLDEAVVVTSVLLQALTGSIVVNVQVPCNAGGSAVVSITSAIAGFPVATLRNGQLDAGETVHAVFSNCRGSAAGATLNGTLTLTVQSADAANSGATNNSTLTASNLAITLPRGGTITLNGDIARNTTSTATSTTSAGSVQYNSRFTTPRLTAATQLNGRSSSFTLNTVDLTRNSSWQGGQQQSSSISGTHTLSATLVGLAFSHSVATDGAVSYANTGLPTAGRWQMVLAGARLVINIASSTAAVQVDDGNNGSIDSTYSFPVSRLQSDAG